jgi:hypothetical protein
MTDQTEMSSVVRHESRGDGDASRVERLASRGTDGDGAVGLLANDGRFGAEPPRLAPAPAFPLDTRRVTPDDRPPLDARHVTHDDRAPLDAGPATRDDPSLPPLVVSGLHVAKADLIAALRFYVPQLTDLRQLDDGSFILRVVPLDSLDDGDRS